MVSRDVLLTQSTVQTLYIQMINVFSRQSNADASNSLNSGGLGEGPLAFLGHPAGTVDWFATILAFLRIFRIFWNLLDSFEFFWNLLDSFGIFWILLESFGFYWNLLDSTGIFWILLNLLDSFWIFLILFESLWFFLNPFDSFWIFLILLKFFRFSWILLESFGIFWNLLDSYVPSIPLHTFSAGCFCSLSLQALSAVESFEYFGIL